MRQEPGRSALTPFRRFRAAALLALATSLAWGARDPSRGARDDALRRWIEGPIRYIATPEEIKEFKKLATDDERAVFVVRFWSRRDPTPGTIANEYRQMFWERVRDADTLFTDSPGPGWKTDRGKVYILYGPPTKIEEDLDAVSETDNPSADRGLIRWVYEGRPAGRMDLPNVVIVPFFRQTGGGWRMSYDPRLASIFFDWMARPNQTYAENILDSMANPTATRLGVMLDLGKMQEVPSQEEAVLEQVETFEAFGVRPLSAQVHRYRAPDGSGTLAVVTVPLVPPSASPGGETILARFASRDPALRTRVLGQDSFRVAVVGGERVAQARVSLEPGVWDLTVLVMDPKAATNSIHRSTLAAEPYTGSLRLSDIALARAIEPVPYASLASYDEAFHVGAFRVTPRTAPVLAPGDPIDLFFEVYGGAPPYRVTYRLEGREDDGSFTPLGRPQTIDPAQAAQGWSFPTSVKWPLRAYRVRVVVEDSSGASVEAEAPFSLAAAAP